MINTISLREVTAVKKKERKKNNLYRMDKCVL